MTTLKGRPLAAQAEELQTSGPQANPQTTMTETEFTVLTEKSLPETSLKEILRMPRKIVLATEFQLMGETAGMARAAKGRRLLKELSELGAWFERQKRVLPWRDEPTLYRVWISEIMLQQTQVITVIPYFEKFVSRFPTVEALASAPEEDVLLHWAGLGYYSRARNIHQAARQIVAAGGFPRTREGWLEIPGVGPYTAGAILSIALDQPESILDGNVERVLSRVRRISRAGGEAAYKSRLWRLSKIFVERAHEQGVRPSVLNQAMMELGATVCTPKKPKCLLCPIATMCRAHQHSEEESFPPKKKPKEWLSVKEEVHCIFDSKGRMLLALRGRGEWRAGLWDFPEESPFAKTKLIRIGKVESKLIVTRHKITRTAHVWRMKAAGPTSSKTTSGLLKASDSAGGVSASLRWISMGQPEVAVGGSLQKTLRQIRDTYPEVLPAHS
jgi:A/G-specific adenine glycosylase